jgi:hypothetical protein
MEQLFGASFSTVRVHPNSKRASELSADACAIGDDLHFAPGEYDPNSTAGLELIGHELAHVVQQRQNRVPPGTRPLPRLQLGDVRPPPEVSDRNPHEVTTDPALEREADEAGRRIARRETVAMGDGAATTKAVQAGKKRRRKGNSKTEAEQNQEKKPKKKETATDTKAQAETRKRKKRAPKGPADKNKESAATEQKTKKRSKKQKRTGENKSDSKVSVTQSGNQDEETEEPEKTEKPAEGEQTEDAKRTEEPEKKRGKEKSKKKEKKDEEEKKKEKSGKTDQKNEEEAEEKEKKQEKDEEEKEKESSNEGSSSGSSGQDISKEILELLDVGVVKTLAAGGMNNQLFHREFEAFGKEQACKIILQLMQRHKKDPAAAVVRHASKLNSVLGSRSIVADTNAMSGIASMMAGKQWRALEPPQKMSINYLRRNARPPLTEYNEKSEAQQESPDVATIIGEGHDLRGTNAVTAELAMKGGKVPGHGPVTLSMSRDSELYQNIIKLLEKHEVGEKKGHADRTIVADTLLADWHGQIPRLITGDRGIICPLFETFKTSKVSLKSLLLVDPKTTRPEQPHFAIARLYPDGFEVSISDHKMLVIPSAMRKSNEEREEDRTKNLNARKN